MKYYCGDMESLKLSDQEKRIYAELFGALDVENTGKVNGKKATDLFLSSGLTQEILHQVNMGMRVCCTTNTCYAGPAFMLNKKGRHW